MSVRGTRPEASERQRVQATDYRTIRAAARGSLVKRSKAIAVILVLRWWASEAKFDSIARGAARVLLLRKRQPGRT